MHAMIHPRPRSSVFVATIIMFIMRSTAVLLIKNIIIMFITENKIVFSIRNMIILAS